MEISFILVSVKFYFAPLGFKLFMLYIRSAACLLYLFVTEGNYKRISSESCEFHGMKSIKSEEMCKFAASYLDLPDTDSYSSQDEGRPYGCIYADNDWLGWYDSTNSPYPPVSCGSIQGSYAYDCICAIKGNTVLFGLFNTVQQLSVLDVQILTFETLNIAF